MIQPVPRQKQESDTFNLMGFSKGLNTSVPANMLTPDEMPECVDFRLGPKGQLIARRPFVKYTASAMTGNPMYIATGTIDGTTRHIIGCSNGNIYYLDGTTPTLIDTAEGEPYLIPFNDVMMVCDGGYLKFLDDVSSLSIAYDMGAFMLDNYSGDDDVGIAVDDSNTRVAVKMTSSAWTAGYTIPITEVTVKLKSVGSPTGAFTVKLRLVSDDSVLASKTSTVTADEISTSGEFVTITFTSDDVTTEMSPETDYYVSFEYADGDASNYLELRCTTVASGGTGAHYSGSWASDTTSDPIVKVSPSLPLKCSFGVVSNRRPWLAGDPDNPGYLWYGYYSHLDFSTSGGGGYLPVIDADSNTFAVGAVQTLFNELFVYGTEDQPYLSRLTGTSPSDFQLPLTYQQIWATQRTLINTKNDLWSASKSGVDALSGVQQYGDFRAFSLTDSVVDRMESWDSDTAFTGYYPDHALFLLYMPTHGKTLVGHVLNGYARLDGRTAYPWTEFDLPVTPTCFGLLGSTFTFGGSDGYLYQPSVDDHLDAGDTQVAPYFKTSEIQFPNYEATIDMIQWMVGCVSGVSFYMDFFKNGDPDNYILRALSNSGDLLVDDATMDVDDATTLLSGALSPTRRSLNITCHTIQLKFHTFRVVTSDEFSMNGCFFRYRLMEV